MKRLKYILIVIITMVIGLWGYMKLTNTSSNELGLGVLSTVKSVSGNKVKLSDMDTSNSQPVDHNDWSYLLGKHVAVNGKVDYRGMSKNKSQLEAYLNKLSLNPPKEEWSKEERLCYWINAYNAFTVKLILDHYPLQSIKDISDGLPMISSPWDIKFFKIGGVDFDLNTIEHEILRKQFAEPRIHFAINCASFSCPKLRYEAYLPKYLEFQLEDQAKAFINNKDKNLISNQETKVSPIFDWFGSDFTQNESLVTFLSNYNAEIQDKNMVTFLEYNWSLNE